ncbi:thioredoxin fold domain-containing protein [Helicobacter brantae]|uniref:Thioredoxin domain-containing protein n=1 Tax=Helicobacter brantae TaxID=375927 RepID=A0A3D8J4L2_9HELI|nr:thioredoxin fold domain-containing protein [Helicobacter brantae]RDU71814.1 hypothetical protein CQA58_01870 [Helicobacter brantae]
MRFKEAFLFLALLFFVGCESEKPTLQSISKGSASSKEAKEMHQNIDKNSYSELLPYLQDNSMIESRDNKGVLLIFGSNQCKYCDKLKSEILKSKALKNALKNDFSSYYINLSYQKTHLFFQNKLDTQMLGETYQIRSTPTLIFLNPKGEMIFKIVGFMGREKLEIALEFISENLNLDEEQIAEKLYNLYAQKSLL